MSEVLDKATKILNLCQEKGNFDAEVYLQASKQYEIIIDQNIISSQSVVQEEGCGLRIINNGQLGFSYSNSLEISNLERMINQAISISSQSSLDEANNIPGLKRASSMDIYSSEVANLNVEDICDMGSLILNGIKEDPRIKLILSSIKSNVTNVAIVNTNEVEESFKSTQLRYDIFGLAREGNKIGSYAFTQKVSRKNDINPQDLLDEFTPKALNGLNVQKLGDLKGSVIFKPAALGYPLGFMLIMSIEGNNVFHKRTQWRDKMGAEVAIPEFQVEDLPRNSEKPTSRPFDDEGIPTENRSIIESGVLKTFLQTSYSAKKNEVEVTGNAFRSLYPSQTSYTNPPRYALPIGMTIQSGEISYTEMIEDSKKGILIGRYSGSGRYQTGEYSGVAKQAVLIEDGEIKYPLIGVMIAGNVFKDLRNITAISKEKDYTDEINFLETPYLTFEGINVSSEN
jgi:PmbA protein